MPLFELYEVARKRLALGDQCTPMTDSVRDVALSIHVFASVGWIG